MRLRTRKVAVALAVVVLVAAAAGAFAFTQLRGGATGPGAALGPPHFVEEAVAAGVDHTYGGPFRYAAGGGVAVFDCDADGRPDLYIAGGENPAALYRNESPVGGALRFTAVPDPVLDVTAVNGAYPIDIDGDGHRRPGRPPRWAARPAARARRLPVRAGQRALVVRRRDAASRPRSARRGRATRHCRHWPSASTSTLDAAGDTTTDCAGEHARSTGRDGRPRTPRRSRWRRASARCRCCSATGTGPAGVTCGSATTGTTTTRRTARSSSGGSAPASRRGCTRPPTAGSASRSRAWASRSYDLTGDGYPDVFLTSQGENRLQTLTAGPTKPTYRDIGLKRGVNAAEPFTGGDKLPSTAWHPEFQDVNNDGFVDLFVSKGNVDNIPDYAKKDPSNLLLGQPDGTFVEGAEAAGILSFAQGRGAALADFNLDGLVDLVEVNYGDRSSCGGTSGRATPRPRSRWATGRAPGEPARAEPRCDRRLDRGPGRRPDDPARDDYRRWPASRASSAGSMSAWGPAAPPTSGSSGRTARWPVAAVPADGFARSSAARPLSDPGSHRHPERRRDPDADPAPPEVRVPDFEMPEAMPVIPASTHAGRLDECGAGPTRGATTGSSCTPIGSTAPTCPA